MYVCGSGPDFFEKISSQHGKHLLFLLWDTAETLWLRGITEIVL